MSALLSLLHGTTLVLGVLTWAIGGLWIARTALVERKVTGYWQAASLLFAWPFLGLFILFQLAWDWMVD